MTDNKLAKVDEKTAVSVPVAAAMTREEAEIKAAVWQARACPRNEYVAMTKLLDACKRAGFAEKARYSYPRGGSTIEGPSVNLAREAARLWGNIRYGVRVLSDDGEDIHIQAVAYDLESNNMVSAEDKFKNRIFRKGQGWIVPDERDKRELTSRRSAFLIRNCLLQLIPPDIIDDAMIQARHTLSSDGERDLKKDKKTTIKAIVQAFSEISVSVEMLEKYLGHSLDEINADEIARLRSVRRSIADGHSTRSEHFNVAPVQTKASINLNDIHPKNDELKDQESHSEFEATKSQKAKIAILCKELDCARAETIKAIIGKTSSRDLTSMEASHVIDMLEKTLAERKAEAEKKAVTEAAADIPPSIDDDEVLDLG